jgi:hypothetical protein
VAGRGRSPALWLVSLRGARAGRLARLGSVPLPELAVGLAEDREQRVHAVAGDAALNEAALEEGARLLSVYRLADGGKVYVVTEADRSCTTAMLAEEY